MPARVNGRPLGPGAGTVGGLIAVLTPYTWRTITCPGATAREEEGAEYPDPARLMALEGVAVGCALESTTTNNAGASRRTVFMSKGPYAMTSGSPNWFEANR